MAPAPMMTRLLGCVAVFIASRAPMILSPSNLAKGSSRATDPVAMSTLVAVIVSRALGLMSAGACVSVSCTLAS